MPVVLVEARWVLKVEGPASSSILMEMGFENTCQRVTVKESRQMGKACVGAQMVSFKAPRLLRAILVASRGEDATSFHRGSHPLPLNCQTSAVWAAVYMSCRKTHNDGK